MNLKYELSPPVNMDFIKKIDYEIKYELMPNSLDGLLFEKEIIINATRPQYRQRFSQAHEIGHIFIPWYTGNFSYVIGNFYFYKKGCKNKRHNKYTSRM